MQIVSSGDNLHAMSNACFLGKIKKSISKCRLLKILHRVLSVNVICPQGGSKQRFGCCRCCRTF